MWAQLADWTEDALVGWYRLTRWQLPDLAAGWHTRWRPAALAAIAVATNPEPGALASGCRQQHKFRLNVQVI